MQLDQLIIQIQSDQNKNNCSKMCETLVFSIFNPNATSAHEESTTGINGQFLYSQLLIECLIRMKSTMNEKNELISLCKVQYKRNNIELENIRKFEQSYTTDSALEWYSRQSFLYRDLNRALRTQNINLLFVFRFFIRDLAQKLEQHRCSSPIHTYRGQFISNEELRSLRDAVGQFASIHSFFSTTLNREVALFFLGDSKAPNGLQRVLFEVEADPCLAGTKPFANISSISNYSNEEEVLMMIGSVFRLTDVHYGDNQTWIIKMRLCSDNEHDLKSISDHMRNEYFSAETIGLGQFGTILRSMGKFDDAEKYYLRLLKDSSLDHQDIASCYWGLGIVVANKGQYDQSLQYHERALQIYQRTSESNYQDIADIYNCIGSTYKSKEKFTDALKSYNKALIIYQQVLHEDHHNVAMCLGNIGSVYENIGNYLEALEYHQKALNIWQKSLPTDHHRLGSIHNNIANVYYSLRQWNLALRHYNQSLEIKEKSLPHQHPSVANTLNNIGNVYENMGQFQRAFTYFNQAAEIYNHTLPPTHSDVININKSIRQVSSRIR